LVLVRVVALVVVPAVVLPVAVVVSWLFTTTRPAVFAARAVGITSTAINTSKMAVVTPQIVHFLFIVVLLSPVLPVAPDAFG
jgi:hypothetical protein